MTWKDARWAPGAELYKEMFGKYPKNPLSRGAATLPSVPTTEETALAAASTMPAGAEGNGVATTRPSARAMALVAVPDEPIEEPQRWTTRQVLAVGGSIIVAFCLLVWAILPPPRQFTVASEYGVVRFMGKFPDEQRTRVANFIRKEIAPRGKMYVKGRWTKDGGLRLSFSGSISRFQSKELQKFILQTVGRSKRGSSKSTV